ncbi:MAG TPA: UrcA family protein [Caulobacteraceae bacterium]|nr:UrcA family protein [Caulobacteraceae bacterium]
MSTPVSTSVRLGLKTCAAAAFGLALAGPAAAQPYHSPYDDDPYTTSGITVTAPPSTERDAATGAPIEWVSASRVVRYDDLDLNRGWGVRELRARIARAARSACDELDNAYPITASDSPPCVRNAIRQAMYEVPSGY